MYISIHIYIYDTVYRLRFHRVVCMCACAREGACVCVRERKCIYAVRCSVELTVVLPAMYHRALLFFFCSCLGGVDQTSRQSLD